MMPRPLLIAAAAFMAATLGLILIRRVSFIDLRRPDSSENRTPHHSSISSDDTKAVAAIGVSMTAACADHLSEKAKDGFALKPTENRTCKIVLDWTRKYKHAASWWLTKGDDYTGELVGEDCIFTTDRSYVRNADLILFDGCFQPHNFSAYPDYRTPSQRWVYVMSEAPTSIYCGNQFLPVDGLFNWTATYKRDSDLVFSYSPGFVLRQEVAKDAIGPKLTRSKTKMAFWYISDCTSEWSSRRSDYVKALRRHMPIDIFGPCRELFPDSIPSPCPKSSDDSMDQCFLQQSKSYKFYLSFENAICRDYITEKLFKVLRPESDVVPVALGATVDDYTAVVPPDSFIHVSNFSSPERLAAYLHYLDEHDDAYLAYHRWRERFVMLPNSGKNSIDQQPPSQLHQLCAAAHQPPPTRVWTDLVSWFSLKRNCKTVENICLTYGICVEENH